ncbi:hypothetical protein, partial [Candidatus Thiosymbion oneisti]|uniref:hypothetical protein n=1 Tax=Candidatus Thiosymbion oneisti TaxID=589554 RepID=UPI001C4077C5
SVRLSFLVPRRCVGTRDRERGFCDTLKLAADRLSWSIRMRKRKRRIGAHPSAPIRVIRRFSSFSLTGNA